jgi:hypothetical protein
MAAAELVGRRNTALASFADAMKRSYEGLRRAREALEAHKNDVPAAPDNSAADSLKAQLEDLRTMAVPKAIADDIIGGIVRRKCEELKCTCNTAFGYRFLRYAKLRFCQLFFGETRLHATTDFAYYFVDEGQDAALCEYQLISLMTSSPSPVFNVFGDTRQLLGAARGISDWTGLTSLLGCRLYSLNENYRNSNQIISWCNREFGMNVPRVGIDGPDVTDVDEDEFVKSVAQLDPSVYATVVCLFSEKAENNRLKAVSERLGAREVKVARVGEVCGEEFDAVYLFPEGMTSGERYVAATRAVTKLVVVTASAEGTLRFTA